VVTHSLIGDDLARVLKVASSVDGVRECHNVRVRGRNDAIHVDCHVLVSSRMTLADAHEIAESLIVDVVIVTRKPQ
jgi:divalent metal cation (Fe/Co/Zn/Cd) transporter